MIGDLLSIQNDIEQLIKDKPKDTSWRREYRWFNQQIKNLQHEREMHLYVTLTMGIAGLLSTFVTIFYPIILMLALVGILFIMFIAYLIHYRKLENTVQYWYSLQKKLKEML